MNLVTERLDMMLNLQISLESLHSFRILILRGKHADGDGDIFRIIGIHHGRMTFRRHFERSPFARRERHDLPSPAISHDPPILDVRILFVQFLYDLRDSLHRLLGRGGTLEERA